jgi:lactose/L-arabinose transport system ATP-binding protein|tara:strand:- start:6630 stop:7739 length:1110 start_codon:yes stop_codon:yes gene_type:complete
MSVIELTDLVKSYGETQVIHGVNLTVEDGEFCVFVGPSGCGKSTLLRMIAGLEETTKGQISIGARDVTHADPVDRGVAMVFQTYALYPHMTVAENMGFGLKMNRVPKVEIKAKVTEASRILQLDDYLLRKPKALSGGQRQRVAIGRAIVRGPEVFLFDEPLSNLDAELRVDMRVEIARLHKEIGATMIYVTHDQVEAMTLADKIVVLRAGVIEQAGRPVDLYNDPANKFVAGFIGSPAMNFLNGVIEQGRVRITALNDLTIAAPIALAHDTGRPVLVGLRPQILTASTDLSTDLSTGSSTGTIPGVGLSVEICEHLGGVCYLYLSTPTGERLVVETRAEDILPVGAEVAVSFEDKKALFFDVITEQRLR